MPDLSALVTWIETHEHTVGVIKWIVAGVVVWWSGLVRAIQDYSRRPTVVVDEHYSSWYVEEHEEIKGNKKVSFVVVLLDIHVTNPTKVNLGVSGFELSIRRPGVIGWWKPISNVGFSALPTMHLSSERSKILPVWFDSFPDEYEHATRRNVDAQHTVSAHAVFALMIDSKNLSAPKGQLELRVRARLGSGQLCTTKVHVGHKRTFAILDTLMNNCVPYMRAAALQRRADWCR